MRAPPVQAKQDRSIGIQDLTKVVMARSRLGLAEKRLVPFEASWNVSYPDDCPCALHRISTVRLTGRDKPPSHLKQKFAVPRGCKSSDWCLDR
jgi:hypothetical protein